MKKKVNFLNFKNTQEPHYILLLVFFYLKVNRRAICLFVYLDRYHCSATCSAFPFLTALLAFGFPSVHHDALMPVLRDLSSGVFTLSYLWLVPCSFFNLMNHIRAVYSSTMKLITGRCTSYQ